MTETTADVFADYLGMTEENATWAYSVPEIRGRCGQTMPTYQFIATSPFAPDPTPGWLYVMAKHHSFSCVMRHDVNDYQGIVWKNGMGEFGNERDPIHAVARALVAADPALRARLEACGDWEGVK